MRNLIRYTVAGVLAVSGQAAFAQAVPQPSSGSADLWLFVSDTAASVTFAEDTGVSINSILPPASLSGTSGNVLATSISASLNVAPTAALTNFISTYGAGNLTYTVEAGQYASLTSKQYKAGNTVGITSNNAATSQTSAITGLGLTSWMQGFNSDVTYLNSTYATGGSTYSWTSGTTAGNVWGASGASGLAGSTNLYNQGADSSGVGVGSSVALYGITGNGVATQAQSFVLGQLTLSATGTLSTGSGSPVPLPAAAWLLGSGLLGLAGIGRRRAVAA